MIKNKKIKVGVNGYGVIGKQVADAIVLQDDMELVGVADISSNWRIKVATARSYVVYASTKEAVSKTHDAGADSNGTLENLLRKVDVIVDATPKDIGAKNKPFYDQAKVKSIFQGEKNMNLRASLLWRK